MQEEGISYEEEQGEERIESRVLFRSGETEGSETYVPRLMLMDTRGSRGAMRQGVSAHFRPFWPQKHATFPSFSPPLLAP